MIKKYLAFCICLLLMLTGCSQPEQLSSNKRSQNENVAITPKEIKEPVPNTAPKETPEPSHSEKKSIDLGWLLLAENKDTLYDGGYQLINLKSPENSKVAAVDFQAIMNDLIQRKIIAVNCENTYLEHFTKDGRKAYFISDKSSTEKIIEGYDFIDQKVFIKGTFTRDAGNLDNYIALFTPDHTQYIANSEEGLVLYDLEKQKKIRVLFPTEGESGIERRLYAFSKDNQKLLVSESNDFVVYDVKSSKELYRNPNLAKAMTKLDQGITEIAMQYDEQGKTNFYLVMDDEVRLLDFPAETNDAVLAPDKKTIIYKLRSSKDFNLRDLTTGEDRILHGIPSNYTIRFWFPQDVLPPSITRHAVEGIGQKDG
ncbi:hypothetical protein [Paenibacillus tyrfis]|uniref:Lipoprotein n=1 Tax=Paenibacillus tyrfis TaxID=1501230 RepID=A0A081P706_9BACL|nr:hypothetical protein [Paenibacillus tyrfis]KEQ26479.1 hypothetical protein ET33_32015 [Paenibacillus tyrfis]